LVEDETADYSCCAEYLANGDLLVEEDPGSEATRYGNGEQEWSDLDW